MREHEAPVALVTDKELVASEIGKAFSLFAQYIEEDNRRFYGEPSRAQSEPMPWEAVSPVERSSPGSAEYAIRQTDAQQGIGDQATASSSEAAPDNGKEKQPKIRVEGRIVRDPDTRPTRNGMPRVSFTLAEHPEPGQTVYHPVYSTKTYAERIQAEALRRGELAKVVGSEQTHVKVRHGKPVVDQETGEFVTEKVIYAYSAKRLASPGGAGDTLTS